LKVLYRLKNAGYQGYLVGGGVRDLLLGLPPKDFDVVTDALPEEVKKLFRNCRLIGRRFRLAHIYFGAEIIEVATFRTKHQSNAQDEKGRLLRDNVYGQIDQDVLRRDFTINAIYYNIQDFSLVDYVGGLEDIQKKQLRIIGEPEARYREDPVRMLRALRFASKLELKLHRATVALLPKLAGLIQDVAPARLFEEYLKLFFLGKGAATFNNLVKYGLFGEMFPQVSPHLKEPLALTFIQEALSTADQRFAANKGVSPVFLLAVFLWAPLLAKLKLTKTKAMPWLQSQQVAMEQILSKQKQNIMIPKNFCYIIKDIWLLQFKLAKLSASNVVKCYKAASFRLAYDFLLLRASAGEQEIQQLAKWWQDYVLGNEKTRRELLKKLTKK
jgi:poly(A) polymerase